MRLSVCSGCNTAGCTLHRRGNCVAKWSAQFHRLRWNTTAAVVSTRQSDASMQHPSNTSQLVSEAGQRPKYRVKLPQLPDESNNTAQSVPMLPKALAAAERLTVRLRKAVNEEHKAADDGKRQCNISQGLMDAGKQLADLRIAPDGQLHGSFIWKLQLQERKRIPFNRLQKRTAVALAHSPLTRRQYRPLVEKRAEGGQRQPTQRRCMSKMDIEIEGSVEPCRATVLAADNHQLRIVVDTDVNQLLEDIHAEGRQWMVTEVDMDVTRDRQITALNELLEEEVTSTQHRRVREIIAGSPEAVQLAKTPLLWTQHDQSRALLRHALASLRSSGQANNSQARAIATAAMQSLTLWQGPPGTGKTRTLHSLVTLVSRIFEAAGPEAAQQLGFGQILAMAGTNAAADNLLEGLIGHVRVVRVGQPATVRDDLRNCTLTAIAERSTDGKKAVGLRQEAAKLKAKASQLATRKHSKAELKELVTDERKLLQEAAKLLTRAEYRVLDQAQVVVCTCASAGHQLMEGRRFPMLVIDEASQITEPVTLIGLVKGVECCVMAGDPQQLPPTVTSQVAAKMNLGQTLFARLVNKGLGMELLDVQYRMHPAIADFPSKVFYNGRLTSGVTPEQRPLPQGFKWPNPSVPVALVPCESGSDPGEPSCSEGSSAQGDNSYYNRVEADKVISIVLDLLAADDIESLAILTPYSGQVRLLTKQLSPEVLSRVTVSSVDAYQGREADVVVFSVVRNNPEGNLGFVKDRRRLNVAITRPRRGLIIVGSPAMLETDNTWLKWLAWVRRYKAVMS